MANRRQKKKAGKKAANYEGTQYRGGRTAGRKNLTKTETGNLVNQFGVIFSPDEKRILENAVNTANRKRAKMLKEAATLPRMVAGRDTGDTVGSLQLMGKESDFILSKKTKSLQRFRTREQFDSYVDYLKRVNSPDYINERVRAYKRNFMKTIEDVYGDEAKDIVMKVRMMKPDAYMKLVESDESLEIGAVIPSDAKVAGRLNTIRRALGMKEKPEFIDEEYDV
jgi:hypothetical protein